MKLVTLALQPECQFVDGETFLTSDGMDNILNIVQEMKKQGWKFVVCLEDEATKGNFHLHFKKVNEQPDATN